MNEEPKYDGTIIEVADGYIENGLSAILLDREITEGRLPPDFLQANADSYFLDPTGEITPIPLELRLLLKGINSLHGDEIEFLLKGSLKEIVEVILEGRIRVIQLINSKGGDTRDDLLFAYDQLKKRGGTVEAYVASMACSAAAVLMQNSDSRYVLDDSVLMWHSGERPYTTGEEKRRFLEKHVDQFENFVEKSPRSWERLKLLWALDQACEEDERGTVYLDGKHLGKAGLAITLPSAIDQELDFLRRTGLSRKTLPPKINLFFALSALHSFCRKIAGYFIDIIEINEENYVRFFRLKKWEKEYLNAEEFKAAWEKLKPWIDDDEKINELRRALRGQI